MKTLLVHVHDLTVLVNHNWTLQIKARQMVKHLATNIVEKDQDIAPAAFIARLVSELVQDSRFENVGVMTRFEAKSLEPGDIFEVSFETGKLETRKLS